MILRFIAVAALAAQFAPAVLAAERKSRVINASPDAVFAAAIEVAKEGYLVDRILTEQHRLRFRTGPLRLYSFDVVVTPAGTGKTRIDLELRTNYFGVQSIVRDAWRSGDHYLSLVTQRFDRRK